MRKSATSGATAGEAPRTPSRSSRPGDPADRRVARGTDRADPARLRGPPRSARARSRIAAGPRRRRSAVPDVLAPGLAVVFCGINPGRFSDAAAAHFANPRNDFWRLLARRRVHARGCSSRPSSSSCSPLGIGITNAAYRTTPGSGDLRARRLRGQRRAARGARARASAGRDRLRRQGGVPRRVPRAARARPPGAPARRDGALRAPVDVAGERGGPVDGAAALVPGAGRAARRPRPRQADAPVSASASRCSCRSPTSRSACWPSSTRRR